MIDFSAARRAMVDGQLRTADVTRSEILDIFTVVPREVFVDASEQSVAYADRPVTAVGGAGRKLLSPMCLARMIQAADVHEGDSVLDMAAGSGYSSALMAGLGGQVTLLEETDTQVAAAKEALKRAGVDGVKVVSGSLSAGGKKGASYDVIFVNGRCEEIPQNLLSRLKDGGKLVAIVGSAVSSDVRVYTATDGSIGEKRLMSSAGPLISAFIRVPAFVF